ncbi:MAG: NTP transferase domain-containing protein [Desulfobacteraceae bacterium]
MKSADIAAIILSAGLSERMGRFKPLLPLAGRCTIDRAVDLFRGAGIEEILVVAGHRADEVFRALEPFNIRPVINPDYRQGMFSSVLTGVRSLSDQCPAFFIHPVDIPLVRSRTVQRLTKAFLDHPSDVLYPTFDGRRGHPTLIRTGLIPFILQWPGDGGLKGCLQRHGTDSRELPVIDEAILLDLDTPGDYDGMLERLTSEGLPSAEECRVLMEEMQIASTPIADHCRAVAKAALALSGALIAAGVAMDMELVRSAALLHDIARDRKNHAQAGAHLLERHGFDRLAPIVGAHMDIDASVDQPVDEDQVVYLADKVMEGDRYADLDPRFRSKMGKCTTDRGAVEAIGRRWENARMIRAKVERITGRSIEDILENFHGEE